MSDQTFITGLLYASNCFSEKWVKRMLPPEHTIIAVKPGDPCTEYLVRGSLMHDGDIAPLFTMQEIDGEILITGELNGHSWTVGKWPSLEAFSEEKRSYE